jgi:hypothetical protein
MSLIRAVNAPSTPNSRRQRAVIGYAIKPLAGRQHVNTPRRHPPYTPQPRARPARQRAALSLRVRWTRCARDRL